MSSLIVLQVAAVGLVLVFLYSVRKSLRASDAPPAPAPAPAILPATASPEPIPAPVAPPEPAPPSAYEKPRLVSSTDAPIAPARPATGAEELTADEEIALLERERDAALQQSAAAWKLLVQTRAERDRLREELDQTGRSLAAAEEALEEAARKRLRTTRRRTASPEEAKSAS